MARSIGSAQLLDPLPPAPWGQRVVPCGKRRLTHGLRRLSYSGQGLKRAQRQWLLQAPP